MSIPFAGDAAAAATSVATPLLVRAAQGRPGPYPPVWFMRQAGRSLPEYRALRVGTTMLEACRTPELVTEITLQPVRRHGVDAAILFSDIVVPLAAIGFDVDIVPGVGPVVAQPDPIGVRRRAAAPPRSRRRAVRDRGCAVARRRARRHRR